MTSLHLRLAFNFLLAASLVAPMPVQAQVLARPGWAGSGVAPESWWPRAVFYRLDPLRFQDADGDGQGDVSGLISRLDYLQSLGVDALILDGAAPLSPDDLSELVHGASEHRLRVLVTLRDGGGNADTDGLRAVHDALGAGAAGVWVPHETPQSASDYVALLGRVRALVTSFPGDRVLLTDPAPVPVSLAPAGQPRRIDPRSFHNGRGDVLVLSAAFALEPAQPLTAAGTLAASPLVASLAAVSRREDSGEQPLLAFAHPPATAGAGDAAGALALLGSRGAVLLDFGEELGLDLYARPRGAQGGLPGALPVMQWTPRNQTPAAAIATTEAAAKPVAPQFGAYHPYIPPPRGLAGASPSTVEVVPDRNLPDALPAPDSLPGFTSGTLPNAPLAGGNGVLSVVTEDRDPESLLNLYRQLIALHHGSPTLRNGSQLVLPDTTPGVVAWVRRPPPGARTSGMLLAAINLTDRPLTLFAGDTPDGGRTAPLRTLVSYPRVPSMTGQSTAHLVLGAHAVFLGELGRGGLPVAGSAGEAAASTRHRGHRRHRVRR